MWRDLLRTGNEAISARYLLDTATTLGSSGQRMVDALAGKQASSLPDYRVLMAFLITYILLLAPVNYLILKRLDRREMGWVSIPILIVGFVATSYLIALSIKGGALKRQPRRNCGNTGQYRPGGGIRANDPVFPAPFRL